MTTDPLKPIAQRIQALREIAGTPAPELARTLGVTPDEYAAYESGAADIPIGFLHRVAEHHRVDLTAILTGDESHVRGFCITRRGTGPTVSRRQQYNYESLAAGFQHRRMEPFLVTVDPQPESGAPVQVHAHPGQELNYVLDGALWLIIGRHEVELHAGDSIYFDSGLPHAMRALGGKPARFLALIL